LSYRQGCTEQRVADYAHNIDNLFVFIRPERWLGTSRRSIHPFSVRPFGSGPRMCVGKRFGELQMKMLVFKLIRRFRIEWAGGEEEVGIDFKITNRPDREMKFRFVEHVDSSIS
jgi:cytochrome P450